ncbi:MAG: hypothetical protein WKF84_06475 [Pyrinomonadaceae bacterium]
MFISILHVGGDAEAQTINLHRVTTTPEQSINLHPCISGDGRTLAFESSFDLINLRAAKSFQVITATTESDAPPRFFHVANTRALAPTLSQDGKKLAFASKDDPLGSNPDGNSEIFYFDGQVLRQLTHTRPGSIVSRVVDGNFDPSMSDDGKLLAFTSNRDLVTGSNADESFEVFVFNVDSLLFAQVTTASAEVAFEHAKLSGDGQQLAFVRAIVSSGVAVDETRQLIYQEYPSGTMLFARSGNNLSLQGGRSISDSNSKIVFSETDKNGILQVHLYDHHQRTTRQLTQLAGRKSSTFDVPPNPTISGDGTRVAFSTKRNVGSLKGDNSAEIYIYDIPAGEFITVTSAPAQASAEVTMSLSDDGTRIAFNFSRLLTEETVSAPEFNDSSEIYVAEVAQSQRSSNDLLILNAASQLAAPQTTFATGMIAVARGAKLATNSQYAVAAASDGNQRAFPKELSGTTVRINNRLTEIYYASPTHVTFYIPPDESSGERSVVITNADGYETSGMMMIEPSSSGDIHTERRRSRRGIEYRE